MGRSKLVLFFIVVQSSSNTSHLFVRFSRTDIDSEAARVATIYPRIALSRYSTTWVSGDNSDSPSKRRTGPAQYGLKCAQHIQPLSVSRIDLPQHAATACCQTGVLLQERPGTESYPVAHQALGKLLHLHPRYTKPDIVFPYRLFTARAVQLSNHVGSQDTKPWGSFCAFLIA